MVTTSEKFTALIGEMDEIEKLAASIQEGHARDGSKATAETVTKLRTWYLDWYARCRALLSDAGKSQFDKHYSGSYHSIHKFISDPARTFYGRSSSSRHSTQSFYQWKNKFGEDFRDQFNEQRLLLMRARANVAVRESSPQPPPPPAIDTIRLHTRVRAVSSKLFRDGHYRQAIFQACLALNEAVQQRSGRTDLDGTKLMQQVFSINNPILKFDGHPDEQQGYMWLFSGLSMAVRNPRAHKVGQTEDLDANEAIELLAMVSALFRALDSATRI